MQSIKDKLAGQLNPLSMIMSTVSMVLPEKYAEPLKLFTEGFEKLQSITPPDKMEAFMKATGDLLSALNPQVMKYQRPDVKDPKVTRTYVAIIFEQPLPEQPAKEQKKQ
jgi:hypothetical protein